MHTRACALAFHAFAILAPAVPAAGADVTVYGFLKADAEVVQAAGVRTPRIANDLSVLGMRGTEDLGGGLQAVFQIEMPVAVDTGGGGDFTRNTAVGLRGRYGQVLLGIWESPYRFVSVYAVDPFTSGIFASNGIMGNGFVTAANGVAPASFDRRQKNLLQYVAPAYRGLNVRVALSAREEADGGRNPGMAAGLVTYESGNLYLAYGVERHIDYFAAGSRDVGHKVGAAYGIGGTRLRATWEALHYEPGAGTHLRRHAFQLAATHTAGRHIVRASVTRALAARGNATVSVGGIVRPGAGSDAAQHAIGYGYALSQRSEVWTSYTRLSNGRNAAYNLSANPVAGLTAGQDATGAGLGILHKF